MRMDSYMYALERYMKKVLMKYPPLFISALRILPIHPRDFDLFGFKFDDKYYIGKCFHIGFFVSCKVCEEFATF